MRIIYHLVLRRVWELRLVRGQSLSTLDCLQVAEDGVRLYQADSLASEGFIHCSFVEQLAWVANRFYADAEDLLLLHIDAERLTSPLREEPCDTGEIFPHIYGPLNRDAVVKVETPARGTDGRWQFSGS